MGQSLPSRKRAVFLSTTRTLTRVRPTISRQFNQYEAI